RRQCKGLRLERRATRRRIKYAECRTRALVRNQPGDPISVRERRFGRDEERLECTRACRAKDVVRLRKLEPSVFVGTAYGKYHEVTRCFAVRRHLALRHCAFKRGAHPCAGPPRERLAQFDAAPGGLDR